MAAKKTKTSSVPNAERVIAHLDADCFEVQIYQLENPATRGQPCVVGNKFGRITSVSYEARAYGISKTMLLKEAQAKCTDQELIIFYNDAESCRAKDSKSREIGNKIQKAVRSFLQENCEGNVGVEFGGNDEFWLDLTSEVNRRINLNKELTPTNYYLSIFLESLDGPIKAETHSLIDFLPNLNEADGIKNKLLLGAEIAALLAQRIYNETGIQCSAGLGTNKLIAKLAGALNKPAGMTICPPSAIEKMSSRIPIDTIPRLKGKLGERLTNLLKCETMHDLSLISKGVLIENDFGELDVRLIRMLSTGECVEKVRTRTMPTGVKFSRKFDEKRENVIEPKTLESVLLNMCQGFWERLQEEEKLNNRRLISGSVSLKREIRSISVHLDAKICNSGDDIFTQVMPRFRASVDPAFEPWSNVTQISFNGHTFKKIVPASTSNS